MIRIIFYRSKCIGCNACIEAAPTRWRMSRKDGKSNLVGSIEKKGVFQAQVHEEELEENKVAAINCPVRIIKILED